MRIARRALLPVALLSLFALVMSCQSQSAINEPGDLATISLPEALTNGKPTLAEFGRGVCVACKEMKPILENLAVEYQDRLNVPNVSVDEYRDLTNYYRVTTIPTQICFDSSGKEVYRHVGFWPREEIITQLNKMGIK